MAAHVHTMTFDALDPYAQAQWWCAVLEVPMSPIDEPGDPEALVSTLRGDEEVERIVALGAAVLADLRNPDGTGWVTLADPKGNEFCVVRSAAERP